MNSEYLKWLNSNFITKEEKEYLKNMSEEDINSCFNKDLSFGTAGVRGIMDLGNSRINKYTIAKITLGLSNYLNKNFKNPSVVIGYDTRKNSREFAYITASVLNYNGIKTYIFDDIASTPLVSFSVKELNTTSGIVITSSHNAKIYNGYKVYNSEGAQITFEDKLIEDEINKVDYNDISYLLNPNDYFNYVPKEVIKNFHKENEKVIINKDIIDKYSSNIRVTYTSFHGTGIRVMPFIFEKFKVNYNLVKEQCEIDSNFTYAESPNPEIETNYDIAKKYAHDFKSDVIIASDPDSDRFSFLYKDKDDYKLITGNMIGAIFLYYLLENTTNNDGKFVVKSVVSFDLFDKIAKYYNVNVVECLTGCKNIAKEKLANPSNYLFGYEESLGNVFNINVNDKDAFSSCVFFIEILSYLKSKNMTIKDYIDEIYNKFGYHFTKQISYEFKSLDDINNLMNKIRNDNLFNEKEKLDYLNHDKLNTNLIKFIIDDDSYFMVRPSGTEPKIKFYFNSCDKESFKSIDKLNNMIDMVINKLELV